MKITVCELNDREKKFKKDWEKLIHHVEKNKSDLVLLNEMPFGKWIASSKEVDDDLKAESFGIHNTWIKRIPEFNRAIVIYSKPVFKRGKLFNTAFVWTKEDGHKALHSKYYFPEEEHFYEASWFDSQEKSFEIFEVRKIKIGVLICSELWMLEHARSYGLQGADIIVTPRATGKKSVKQWLTCGQTAAMTSGAYSISSNRAGEGDDGFKWGGSGWVIRPGDGKIVGLTSGKEPFVTVKLNLKKASEAKQQYPLNIHPRK